MVYRITIPKGEGAAAPSASFAPAATPPAYENAEPGPDSIPARPVPRWLQYEREEEGRAARAALDGRIGATEPQAWTPLRQRVFLENLALNGCVKSAAGAAGMSRESAYRLRRRVDARTFRLGWEAAMVEAAAGLHEVARERALVGATERVWRDGELVAERQKPSDRLLVHLLNVEAARLAGGKSPPPLAAVLNRLERDAARVAAGRVPSHASDLVAAGRRADPPAHPAYPVYPMPRFRAADLLTAYEPELTEDELIAEMERREAERAGLNACGPRRGGFPQRV